MLFAQSNHSTITQTGDNQEAYTTQTGNTNVSTTDQLSTNTGKQISHVRQTGTENSADVDQTQTGGGGISPANTADLTQDGYKNVGIQYEYAPGYNQGQHEVGEQYGDMNRLEQRTLAGHTQSQRAIQTGDENEAYQTTHNGGHNTGEVYQTGNLNDAYQDMRGSNNGYMSARILINQVGNSNLGKQDIEGHGSSHKNHAVIDQEGDGNTGDQFAYGRDMDLQIYQHGFSPGYDNYASQHSVGLTDVALIEQIGDENNQTQVQDGDANLAEILTIGDKNSYLTNWTSPNDVLYAGGTSQTQLGDLNKAGLKIEGDLNMTHQYQSGAGHISEIGIVGNENQVATLQDGTTNSTSMLVLGDLNVVANDQSGVSNMSYVDVDGYGNTVCVSQLGTSNISDVDVLGDLNLVKVKQEGDFNNSDVDQVGNSNTAIVNQYGYQD
jgi:hypothetical protein